MNSLRSLHPPTRARVAPQPGISRPRPAEPRHIRHAREATLDAEFRERVRRSPNAVAHIEYDSDQVWRGYSWTDCAGEVGRWQHALAGLGLAPGDRLAILLRNCRHWVIFDQAALGVGLVTVPLYTNDRPANIEYILQDSGARVLLLEDAAAWERLGSIRSTLDRLDAVIALHGPGRATVANLYPAERWLPDAGPQSAGGITRPDTLASIVYTSGTSGRPKGVMLSHRNFLSNAHACLDAVAVSSADRLLSFLPLSHTLERTVGYYAAVSAGIATAYARSVTRLAEDLVQVRPTILIAVPRVFERMHARILGHVSAASPTRRRLFDRAQELGWRRFLHAQRRGRWSPALLLHPLLDPVVGARVRARLGGRLRFAISGGAPLPEAVGRFFIACGVPVLQGYGLTETSPVIAVNRLEDNEPATVGPALPGVEVRIGEHDELCTRSPSVMAGYWNDRHATRAALDADGWLHTGDQARIGPRGHITITGRLKDILVLSNGEKVAPADVEQALAGTPWVEQVMVIGEGRPFLAALVVLRAGALPGLARAAGLDPAPAATHDGARTLRRKPAVVAEVLKALQPRLAQFPGYLQLRAAVLVDEPWTVANGLLTPTLKLRRGEILERCRDRVEALYQGR
ncbi:AMP-dependent synthetase/ligase [Thioalkalivibrio paradoxus]|uniref:AMP-dependent synthetase n=1 Tax=Thioalkalivibrio paradoxus ARh 1 TaxID=713585 RepID=W0DMC3_9GAMM|nr:AMP-dependent synthetase/ligase [Thioalkalivibrio paradoxus]AHE98045.1 AMP-dependent synthetase [Thioalkalivibrio paradoxus ARh 1]